MALLAQQKRKEKYGFDPRNTNWSSDDSKFGQKLMEKMGWEKGKGLGANEDGMVDHIKASYKADTRGLGCTPKEADAWVAHQEDFNDLLKKLNEDSGRDVEKETTTDNATSEGKKRFYGRFARGRVQTLRSTEDLDCILGRRKTSETSTPVTQSAANSDDEDKDNTITSSYSVQEYFAKKMKALKARQSSDGVANEESEERKGTSTEKVEAAAKGEDVKTKSVYGAVQFSYNDGGESSVTEGQKARGLYDDSEWTKCGDDEQADDKREKRSKKKKKKDKNVERPEDNEDQDNISKEIQVDENSSKKKKKSKRKHRDTVDSSENEKETDQKDNFEESEDLERPKSKKRKQVNEQLNEDSGIYEKEKKSKKRGESKDGEEAAEDNNENNCSKQKTKKKKKSKNKTCDVSEDSLQPTEGGGMNIDKLSEECQDQDNSKEQKKKKKKKKKLVENEDDLEKSETKSEDRCLQVNVPDGTIFESMKSENTSKEKNDDDVESETKKDLLNKMKRKKKKKKSKLNKEIEESFQGSNISAVPGYLPMPTHLRPNHRI